MKRMAFFFPLWQQHQIDQGEGKDQSSLPFSVFPGLETECNSEPLFAVYADYTIAGGARGCEKHRLKITLPAITCGDIWS